MSRDSKQENGDLQFKAASLEQLWSCLQRFLLFEEPSDRWTKVVSMLGRLARSNAKDLAALPLSLQEKHFASVFGTPPELLDDSARLFNLLLALQNLRNFESADFDLWFFSQTDEEVQSETDDVFKQIAESALGESPSTAQLASLTHAWNIVPYWRSLESPGPWSESPLADFVSAVLQKIDRRKPGLDLDSVLALDKEFQSILTAKRELLPAAFQPQVLVLVEGSTELILLPRFLKISGRGSNGLSVTAFFMACGGANQIVRKYMQLRDACRLPILCVIDHDAEEQIDSIGQILRSNDMLHVWSCGEIEDTFAASVLLNNLNAFLKQLGSNDVLMPEDLNKRGRRTELLDRLWRKRGLGDFDKVGFAEFQAGRIKQAAEIPKEGLELMQMIKKLAQIQYSS